MLGCGKEMGLYNKARISVRDNLDNYMDETKLPLLTRKAFVLSISMDLKCNGPNFAAGKATSLMDGFGLSSNFWQTSLSFSTFSGVR